jgi:hypothetical protein
LTLPLSDRLFLIPEVSYTEMDADGDANSYDSVAGGLAASYTHGQLEIFIQGQFSMDQYEQSNPVFNAKREDDNYGISAGLSYREPLGWENIRADVIVGNQFRESNIDFFESNSKWLAVGLTWNY